MATTGAPGRPGKARARVLLQNKTACACAFAVLGSVAPGCAREAAGSGLPRRVPRHYPLPATRHGAPRSSKTRSSPTAAQYPTDGSARRIEWRQVLSSYQDYHMLLLIEWRQALSSYQDYRIFSGLAGACGSDQRALWPRCRGTARGKRARGECGAGTSWCGSAVPVPGRRCQRSAACRRRSRPGVPVRRARQRPQPLRVPRAPRCRSRRTRLSCAVASRVGMPCAKKDGLRQGWTREGSPRHLSVVTYERKKLRQSVSWWTSGTATHTALATAAPWFAGDAATGVGRQRAVGNSPCDRTACRRDTQDLSQRGRC